MKKTVKIAITFILLFGGIFSAQAQTDGVSIAGVQMIAEENMMQISFFVDVNKKAVKSDYELILTPVLVDGKDKACLTPIVVQGKRAKISQRRAEMSKKNDNEKPEVVVTRNGERVEYKITIAYEEWMKNASLEITKLSRGCCTKRTLPKILLTQKPTIINKK